tara:strand:+ start:1724 stop:2167 length:444 start_codon:yes stop_codon:yes gene_type:complete
MDKEIQNTILCINSTCKNDYELKDFLYSNLFKENKCEICGQLPIWNSKKLEFNVFRKIKKNNNLLDNLLILCPNCLSQKQPSYKKKSKKCLECGKNFFSIIKKISLDPSSDLINPKKDKIKYQQTRCKFCLVKYITVKEDSYNTKVI